MNTATPREKALEKQLAEVRQDFEAFTYAVSHDLKSPLHTIMGFVDLILEDLAAGRQQTMVEDLSRVREASQALQGQLDAVLLFSRLGRAAHVPVEISVDELGEGLHRRWDAAFARVGGRLELEGRAKSVYADPVKFAALMDHLLDNALKFRSENRALCVDLRFDEEGETIGGQIRDNGKGVPPEQLERIFEMFRKVDSNSLGRGVGLTLARKLVGLHGGRIEAQSAGLETGLTVHFVLPKTQLQHTT